jgi:hypothetical protein
LLTQPGFLLFKLQNFPGMIKMNVKVYLGENPMEASQSHLDQILDEIASLSLEDQELLLNIVKKRHIEKKREQILRDSRETMRAYKKGLAKKGTVDDLMKDLESD